MTVRYCHPSGTTVTGNCTTNATDTTACTFQYAATRLVAGDTLIVKGTTASGLFYSTPVVLTCNGGSPNAANGTSGNPITVIAENEREAWLKGNGFESNAQLHMTGCDWWVIDGLQASKADSDAGTGGGWDPMDFFQCDDLIVRNCLIHHADRFWNAQLLLFYECERFLAEDCEGYWFHANGFLTKYTTTSGTWRRCYLNGRNYTVTEGLHFANPETAPHNYADHGFSVYPGDNITYENCVTENCDGAQDIQSEQLSSNNKYLGCISIGDLTCFLPKDRQTVGQFWAEDTYYENCIAVGAERNAFFHRGCDNSQHVNCTAINGAAIDSDQQGAFIADVGVGTQNPDPTCSYLNCLAYNNVGNGFFIQDQDSFTVNYCASQQNDWNLDTVGSIPFNTDAEVTNEFLTTITNIGTCLMWLPLTSNLKSAGIGGTSATGASKADIGANILYRYHNGTLTATPLWNPSTGAWPFKAIVTGINDSGLESLCTIHTRLNVNTGGCSFPAGYVATGGGIVMVGLRAPLTLGRLVA